MPLASAPGWVSADGGGASSYITFRVLDYLAAKRSAAARERRPSEGQNTRQASRRRVLAATSAFGCGSSGPASYVCSSRLLTPSARRRRRRRSRQPGALAARHRAFRSSASLSAAVFARRARQFRPREHPRGERVQRLLAFTHRGATRADRLSVCASTAATAPSCASKQRQPGRSPLGPATRLASCNSSATTSAIYSGPRATRGAPITDFRRLDGDPAVGAPICRGHVDIAHAAASAPSGTGSAPGDVGFIAHHAAPASVERPPRRGARRRTHRRPDLTAASASAGRS